MDSKKIFFVSGIDTDIGKTVVTGVLAHEWMSEGKKVITQKFIQTGVSAGGISEDILSHRKIMGIDLLPEDLDGTTCPVIFSYPASPHLAAALDGRSIDLERISLSTKQLSEKFDIVLLEGAGGLLVPIDGLYTTADYIQEHRLPLILVTSPRLGSLNHTLLSLEVCRNRGIEVAMVVYNQYPATSEEITNDTRKYLQSYLAVYHPDTVFIEINSVQELI